MVDNQKNQSLRTKRQKISESSDISRTVPSLPLLQQTAIEA